MEGFPLQNGGTDGRGSDNNLPRNGVPAATGRMAIRSEMKVLAVAVGTEIRDRTKVPEAVGGTEVSEPQAEQ